MPLAGRPMVEWSVAAMRAAGVRSIVVACPPGHEHGLGGEDLEVIAGGATRAQSVANALGAVDTELVAIHDAARPLVTSELVEGVVATLVGHPEAAGAVAAAPVSDTIKRAASNDQLLRFDVHRVMNASVVVVKTVDRDGLWAAQTPQVFRTAALREAIAGDRGASKATDEAMLIEAAGGRVLIHPAPPQNLKVTTPLDLRLAELLLRER